MRKDNLLPIIAITLLVIGGIVGTTIAYFSSNATFANEFKTKPYSTEARETFVSPDNWTPGTTTEKEVIAKNTGDVDVAVRVSYSENWRDSHGEELPLIPGEEPMAIINFANQDHWIKNGNYYYYNKKLSKNEETSSFIDSVTFNKNAIAALNCTTTTTGDQKSVSCTSTGTGYDGATYTLNVFVEIVQYKEIWSTNVDIFSDVVQSPVLSVSNINSDIYMEGETISGTINLENADSSVGGYEIYYSGSNISGNLRINGTNYVYKDDISIYPNTGSVSYPTTIPVTDYNGVKALIARSYKYIGGKVYSDFSDPIIVAIDRSEPKKIMVTSESTPAKPQLTHSVDRSLNCAVTSQNDCANVHINLDENQYKDSNGYYNINGIEFYVQSSSEYDTIINNVTYYMEINNNYANALSFSKPMGMPIHLPITYAVRTWVLKANGEKIYSDPEFVVVNS